MKIQYFIWIYIELKLLTMCDTDQFSAFEWIRKNKKHKNKSIGFCLNLQK